MSNHIYRNIGLALTLIGFTCLSMGCNNIHPYSETGRYIMNVTIFEDVNEDGSQNSGEKFLSDVLVIGNPYSMNVSDEKGQAVFDIRAGHQGASISVMPPCGYHPTTETFFNNSQGENFLVGFFPDSPQPGLVSLEFHIWEDKDGDGTQNSDEPDQVPAYFGVYLKKEDGTRFGSISGYQGPAGNFIANLGNFCETIWVEVLGDDYGYKKWTTTVIKPLGATKQVGESPNFENKEFQIPYQTGLNRIDWGWQAGIWVPDEEQWTFIRDSALKYIQSEYGVQGFPSPEAIWTPSAAESTLPRGFGYTFTSQDTKVSITTSHNYAVEERLYHVVVEKGADNHWEVDIDYSGKVVK